MSIESAYPDRLMAYASSARASTTAVTRAGNTLSTAIQAFLATNPDPQVISGVTDWGQEMTSYASRKSQIDQWVHDVGVAFQTADSGHPSRPVSLNDSSIPLQPGPAADKNPFGPLPGGPVVTIPTAVAIQQVQAQQRVLQEQQDCTAPGAVGPLGVQPFPPTPDNGPRAEALPPGGLQAATQQNQRQQQFWNWMGGSNLPDDPHAEGASGTGYENPYTNLGGEPTVGDVPAE